MAHLLRRKSRDKMVGIEKEELSASSSSSTRKKSTSDKKRISLSRSHHFRQMIKRKSHLDMSDSINGAENTPGCDCNNSDITAKNMKERSNNDYGSDLDHGIRICVSDLDQSESQTGAKLESNSEPCSSNQIQNDMQKLNMLDRKTGDYGFFELTEDGYIPMTKSSGRSPKTPDTSSNVDLPGFSQRWQAATNHCSDDPAADSSDGEGDYGFLEYHLDDIDGILTEQEETKQRKEEDRIYHIVQELLDTEEAYVHRLYVLIMIKHEMAGVVSDSISKVMFPNIDAIYALHNENLLPALKDRINNWHTGSCLGDIMCRLTPFLKLYTEYVKNFDTASQYIRTWRKKQPKFDKIIKKLLNQHYRGLDIGAMTIEPVQRVPRYELLLKDYLKRLPQDSDDKENTQKALELVSEAAQHFESTMKRDEQISKLRDIQSSLDGHINIFSLSRELIKTTSIMLINRTTQTPVQCSLYLFNDLLMVTRDNASPSGYGSPKQKVIHLIDLTKVKVSIPTFSELHHCLAVRSRIATVEIGFRDEKELSEWTKLFHVQLVESTKRKVLRRSTWQDLHKMKSTTLGKVAPQFVPLHTVTVCMACGTEFTSPKKKKHCAACGMVVCGKCSYNHVTLEYDNDTHRVCDKCMARISLHRTNTH